MSHDVRTSMSVATKRKELSALTSQEVGYLLCQLGLDKHVGSFQRFGVDGVVLAALKTEKDLEGELGMASHVQRVNLISHVKEFVDKKGVPVDLLEPSIELPSIVEAAQQSRLDGSMLAEITDADLTKELKVESRLQRSKLLKKVGGFRTYGVSGSLIGDEDFAAANFDDSDAPPPPDSAPPPDDGEGKYDDDDDYGEEKYAHK
ncbi:hypothetical protein JL721_3831 [Aureococcus anophagefferens]|nr:hypothetical protein JL722_8140 [Aureococcus anophagefferens]KAH8071928.1 hypothetical protein JL721_3831 [Aureococcus anophagefferens]